MSDKQKNSPGQARIKYENSWLHGRRVLVNDEPVGKLEVVKNGWSQHHLKRGTPSQAWNFHPEQGSAIGKKIAASVGFFSYSYLSEIKAVIAGALAGPGLPLNDASPSALSAPETSSPGRDAA